jgi:glycosyltransferase involved in cell wall biosynthesis
MINQKISIITVCYNSAKTIESCIKSVINQTYNNIEYIIIDGNSTDSTTQIINNYRNKISKIIIEDDNGIYDAMNKGIKISSGSVIGILNSDDFYPNNLIIETIMKQISNDKLDGCYGDLCYVDEYNTDKIIRKWKSSEYVNGLFSKGWVPPHPTVFLKKYIYDTHGYFDLKYTIASDFDMLVKLFYIKKIRMKYFPNVTVYMRNGGKSNSSFSNIIKQNKEILSILNKYRIPHNKIIFFIMKIINRATQYLSFS